MKIVVETHCHSCYSHDCYTSIADIVKQAKKRCVTHLAITDHDCYGLSVKDEEIFEKNNIHLYRAIEFTTKEGVHVIGIHKNIQTFQQVAFFYDIRYLIDILKKINAIIIIPHPHHNTGILGNSNVNEELIDFALSSADFIEKNNRKYGIFKRAEDILKQYPNLKSIVGSDAHKRTDVAAFVNIVESDSEASSIFDVLQKCEITATINKSPSLLNFYVRKIKQGKGYQSLLSLISPNTRKRVKKLFRL